LEIQDATKDISVQRVYRRTYKQLPSDINELSSDFIISLHCNAFNKNASGTEVLYYHKSELGKKSAEILQDELVGALSLKNRGIKPRSVEDRGGHLLKYTNAPCIISEPFFIDNDSDLDVVMKNRDKIISAYSNAISRITEFF
jgi:N-acetylmuramoyl-L-alanine amidase